jgi:N-acetylmuramoyl-L-alanine amidase
VSIEITVNRPFFRLRLAGAAICLVGFWICFARLESWSGIFGGGIVFSNSSDVAGSGSIQGAGEADVPGTEELAPLPVLLIDPGHGGVDGGTAGNGMTEKDWTLKVGLALAELLRARGHEVALTRETDRTLPLVERPAVVQAAPRIAVLSIHFNAGASDAAGVETFFSWPKKPEIMARLDGGTSPTDEGQALALAVQRGIHATTGARDRGVKNRPNLAMTSRTLCPSVLIECGFLSNAAESRKIQDPAYLTKIVVGIADGYESWLGNRLLNPATLVQSPATSPPAVTAVAADVEH